jgi:hypothetical protein
MGILDRLRGRHKCKKLIKYQNRVLEFSSKAGLPGSTVELSNFKTAEQKLEEASRLAMIVDDFQFRLCELYSHLKEDTKEFQVYTRKQEGALITLTNLQATLAIFKEDPDGQKENLDLAVRKMQSFFEKLEKFEVTDSITI